ncbi:hypothetical protein [Rhizobium sp. 22-785-1]
MKQRRAIVFCHGARERTLQESGGVVCLSQIFDTILDTSEFSKPWEFNFGYHDLFRGDNVVFLSSLSDAEEFFRKQAFDYILVVGLEWSKDRNSLTRLISENCRDWGILFIRGDMLDLFHGRRYDTRWFIGWRQYLRRWLKKLPNDTRPAAHYFSNELNAFEFPEVVRGKTKVVPVNHSDYIKLKNANPSREDGEIVFIDQAVTFTFSDSDKNHAEERFYDKKRAEQYFEMLNTYLVSMGETTGLGVTVCLHPNAPEDYPSSFHPSFQISRGKTLDHVAKAKLVVTHCSMATAYCHLLKVPTVILVFPKTEMPKSLYKSTIRKASQEKLTLQRWPTSNAPKIAIRPAGHKVITAFLNPVTQDEPLCDVMEQEIKNLAGG